MKKKKKKKKKKKCYNNNNRKKENRGTFAFCMAFIIALTKFLLDVSTSSLLPRT